MAIPNEVKDLLAFAPILIIAVGSILFLFKRTPTAKERAQASIKAKIRSHDNPLPFSYEEQVARSAVWAAARAARSAKEWAQAPIKKHAYVRPEPTPEPTPEPKSAEPKPKSAKKPSNKPKKVKPSKAKVDAPKAEAPKATPKETPKETPRTPNFGSTKIDPTATTHINAKKIKAAIEAELKADKARRDQARKVAANKAKASFTAKPRTPIPKENFYTILGVSSRATSSELKKAWRKQCSMYHPDRETGDEQMMSKVNEAYTVLSDAEARARYDQKNRIL